MDEQKKFDQNANAGGNENANPVKKDAASGEHAANGGEKRTYGGKKSEYAGDRKPFGGKRPAQQGGKPGFGGNRGRNGDGKPGEGGFRGAAGGERRPFGGDRAQKGERRPAGGGFRAAADGEKRPFSGDRVQNGERKPAFRGEKPAFRGEKKHFGGDRTQNGGEKRGYGGDRPARPAGKPGFGGKTVGTKPYSGSARTGLRPARPDGERKPREVQQEGLPARRLALEVIRAVTERGEFIHLALDQQLKNCGLPVIDRRLAARLAYDTIEMRMYLDHALDQIMAKPDTDIKLRNVLRLGACQILLEDRIPESAACNTSVVLCKELGMEGLAGVCNGILRNLVRQKEELVFPDEAENRVKALSVRHSVPEWLVEKLLGDWGEQAVSLMTTRSHDSYITIRPNMTRLDDEAFEAFLQQKAWESERGRVAHSWRIRNMAEIAHDAGFVGGKFSIQSESSMMAALAVSPRRGMQILDCCAAPGGKTCLMAEMMEGTGRVQAWELHEHRVDLIKAQMKRLGLENVRPMQRDATQLREDMTGTMDAVLLDAPCSGLGVMADKPDVKYRATAESVAELVQLQGKLLDTVCQYVKKGGVLVYSTCSVLKEENEKQAEAFLARHPEFELQPLPDAIPAEFRQHEGVGLQLLPDRDGVEGFYICRMRRKRI
ncbi:MAG: 16S rRNA (cytosine(967)-C(5))-methyltransferase RsmB [Clostridia bacterium]|nr:16S rRNA (cytosine(967)-C(5))-methyltransferase RsmB [Clostridia bacterium]